MRKMHILITFTLCLFLSACTVTTQPNLTNPPDATQPSSQNNQQTETPSDPIQTDAPPTDPTSTQPTTTEPDPNALTENEIAKLQDLYGQSGSELFYNVAIGQTYSDPRQIDLYRFFYNGDRSDWTMTDEEFIFLKSAIKDAEYLPLFRATPENMDAILQMCYGLSLQDMQGNGLDRFAYFDGTGCYYNAATSPPSIAEFLKIIGGTHLDNGNLQVFYTANNKNRYVMILKPVDGGYHILSNLKVED